MTSRKVTVFGATGFLGRRVVLHLLDHGFEVRAASRHPERGAQVFRNWSSRLEVVGADVGDDRSVISAVAGAFAVVNSVSLYVERGSDTFRSVHVEAAARVAKCSRGSGVRRLAHVSGIGADAQSHSSYIRSRGEGESAARAAFSEATIIRPSAMFGPDDASNPAHEDAADVSSLSDVRTRSDCASALVCGRRWGGDCALFRRPRPGNDVRVSRSQHLHLQGIASDDVQLPGYLARPRANAH